MNDICEIQVEGRLDATQAGPVEKEVEEAIRGGRYHIRLNLSRVIFLSSAGIRVLLKSHQMLRKLNGSFGILAPSPAAQSVLELSGLINLVVGNQPVAPADSAPATPPQTVEKKIGSLKCTIYPLAPEAKLKCRLVGNPTCLGSLSFTESESRRIKVPCGTLAVGLGAFGNGFGECRIRFGEFLAAGGAAACLPSDGAKTPDYLVTRAAMVPELQVLYALVGEGAFAQCVRFETGADADHTTFSHIVAAALSIADAPAIGWVMLAESAGLIGAALKHSPATGTGPIAGTSPVTGTGSLFDYPAIRDWLAFTPEREFARTLVLVVGFATAAENSALRPFVRPIGQTPYPAAHAHAAVFSIKALPKGPLPLESTVSALFEEERLLGLMHMIGDHREISGVGESLFTRGTLWLAPVGGFEQGA